MLILFFYDISFQDIYEWQYDQFNFIYNIESQEFMNTVEWIITEQIEALMNDRYSSYGDFTNWSKIRGFKNLLKEIQGNEEIYKKYWIEEKLYELFSFFVKSSLIQTWINTIKYEHFDFFHQLEREDYTRNCFLWNAVEKVLEKKIDQDIQRKIKSLLSSLNDNRNDFRQFKMVIGLD